MGTNEFIDFFIIGAGRSGTSLLMGCMDAHPELSVDRESGASQYLLGQAFKGRPDLCNMDNMIDSFFQVCQSESAASTKRFWGKKITTEQTRGLNKHNRFHTDNYIDSVDHFFNVRCKGIKVIFIVRNGKNCIQSKMTRASVGAEVSAERWNYAVDVYKQLVETKQELHQVKYEHLVNKPEETLKQVCQFIEVPYCADMLAGTNNPKIIPMYRRKGFDVAKANGEALLDPEIIRSIEANMAYLGYST